VVNEQHENELTETKKLRRMMAMQAQMVEMIAEGMEREIVDALTKVVFDGKPPARVLYSTMLHAHERRETLKILEQFVETDALEGRDTAEAKANLATETARPIPPPVVHPLDVEVFRGEPPEEVSVKALVAAARYWQGLSRAAFEDEVPSDAPLTDRGRLAAKALAHASFRLARLAVIAGVEPHEVRRCSRCTPSTGGKSTAGWGDGPWREVSPLPRTAGNGVRARGDRRLEPRRTRLLRSPQAGGQPLQS
jgi:hypothetical protein